VTSAPAKATAVSSFGFRVSGRRCAGRCRSTAIEVVPPVGACEVTSAPARATAVPFADARPGVLLRRQPLRAVRVSSFEFRAGGCRPVSKHRDRGRPSGRGVRGNECAREGYGCTDRRGTPGRPPSSAAPFGFRVSRLEFRVGTCRPVSKHRDGGRPSGRGVRGDECARVGYGCTVRGRTPGRPPASVAPIGFRVSGFAVRG